MTVEPSASGTDEGGLAAEPSDVPASGWKDVALRVKAEIREDHTVLAASGVAFWAFLALIPALAAFASILGLVTSPAMVSRRGSDLFGQLPQAAEDLLTTQLETFASRSSGSLTTSLVIAIVLSLWSAAGGMGQLVEGVNVAYDEHDERNFLVRRGLALVFTIGALVFVAVAVAGLAALPQIMSALGFPSWLRTLFGVVFWPILVAGFAVGLAVLYRYGPDRAEPRWRWVSWGAVVAVVVWVAASVALRIYTSRFTSYDDTYGSLAAVVVLMLWLFLTAFSVLLGAEINAELERQTAVDTTVAVDDE